MRTASAVALGFVATIVGVIGAAWLTLAGLTWQGPNGAWEETESPFGIAFAVTFLVGWLALLGWAVAVCLNGDVEHRRRFRITAGVVSAVSVVIVAVACLFALMPASSWA
jgi:amino acid transporter